MVQLVKKTPVVQETALRKVTEWTFKLLLLGNSGVGKTSLTRRYANDETPNVAHMHTIGIDFRTKILNIQNQPVSVYIWDAAGQERFQTIAQRYYQGSDALILVYDVTDRDSFEDVKNWLTQFRTRGGDTALKILVGNKCDVDETTRMVTYEEGQLLSIEMRRSAMENIPFMETSALEDRNVKEMFETIINDLVMKRKRKEMMTAIPFAVPRNHIIPPKIPHTMRIDRDVDVIPKTASRMTTMFNWFKYCCCCCATAE